MIVISDHARKAMDDDGITEEELTSCLEHGQLEIKQFVSGELRYGKKVELKNKTIMVIYTQKKEVIRVITCYTIQRKRWQNR